MKTINNKELYTRQEFANKLGITTRTLQRWIKEKKIAFIKLGGRYYFDNETLNKLTEVR